MNLAAETHVDRSITNADKFIQQIFAELITYLILLINIG